MFKDLVLFPTLQHRHSTSKAWGLVKGCYLVNILSWSMRDGVSREEDWCKDHTANTWRSPYIMTSTLELLANRELPAVWMQLDRIWSAYNMTSWHSHPSEPDCSDTRGSTEDWILDIWPIIHCSRQKQEHKPKAWGTQAQPRCRSDMSRTRDAASDFQTRFKLFIHIIFRKSKPSGSCTCWPHTLSC